MKKVLITGSNGLVGSEAVEHFSKTHYVIGIDNHQRSLLFDCGVSHNIFLSDNYVNLTLDITNKPQMDLLFQEHVFDLIIHCAAQPSHDKSYDIPFTDFTINTVGTLNLLENFRTNCPEAVFIFMSTNKVYGSNPNNLPITELDNRYEIPAAINEAMSIDQTLHSIFGASKASADLLTQEYGRYFGLNTVCFRSGCISGKYQRPAKLHGFLGYLCGCANKNETYEILGYKGKQVRDIIHSRDIVYAFDEFYKSPKCGEVYNIGGGKCNSCSILEALDLVEKLSGIKINTTYNNQHRTGDHICYYSDNSKFSNDYPLWNVRNSLEDIIKELLI